MPQVALLQVTVALAAPEQTVPQAPQLLVSVASVVHTPLQLACPALQHIPLTQL